LDIIDWDRKHYEYPDLPKGFQLTQLEHPIVVGGKIDCIRYDGSEFQVELDHIHLEEDAGKMVHKKGYSLVDFNRA
jgi:aspartyl-tRNA synthetase